MPGFGPAHTMELADAHYGQIMGPSIAPAMEHRDLLCAYTIDVYEESAERDAGAASSRGWSASRRCTPTSSASTRTTTRCCGRPARRAVWSPATTTSATRSRSAA